MRIPKVHKTESHKIREQVLRNVFYVFSSFLVPPAHLERLALQLC
jgi:hypothetical protein